MQTCAADKAVDDIMSGDSAVAHLGNQTGRLVAALAQSAIDSTQPSTEAQPARKDNTHSSTCDSKGIFPFVSLPLLSVV